MSNRNRSPRRIDDDRSNESHFGRRRVLSAGTATALAAVAGCLSDEDPVAGNGDTDGNDEDGEDDGAEPDEDGETGSEGEGGDSDAGDGSDSDEDDEAESDDADLLGVIGAYLQAAADEDTDAMGEVVHESSPLHPAAWEESGWEFQGGDGEAIDAGDYDADVVTEDGSIDDVLELEGAEFWFEAAELEDDLGDEEIALVDVEPTGADAGAVSTWVLVTEAGEWHVFFMGEQDDAPADPEEALEEDLIDEDEDVVEEIDWGFEQEDRGDDNDVFEDVEWAQVVLTDDPGIEADRIVIESTVEGSEFEIHGAESNSWANSYANVTFDPDGDQIVVTAVRDGEETVVHRERYDP